jgi:cytochrome b6-f complex iron-sulfur subunit
MAEKKKMSTADILAAARNGTAGGTEPSATPASEKAQPPEAAVTEPAAAEAVAESAAPAAKPKPASGGAKPSVAEILAAARANKGAAGTAPEAAKPTAAVAKAPAEKPAPKPKVERPAAAAAGAAPAGAGVRDTSSILAAARAAAKPGPVTKSEAAARLKPSAPAKPAKGESAGVVPPMPAKPEYAKAKIGKAPAAPAENRRFFLGVLVGSFLAVGFSTLAATLGLWTLATLRFMFPNVLTEPPSKFKIGFPGDFPPGVVEEKFKAQFGIWPVNVEYKGLRQIVALKTVCTHLGCTPNWLEAEQKFKCPCHGSGFYKDGVNFEGPAPRPLERYAIRLSDDGQLEVDKSRTFQEELGQWNDPGCFVQV